MTRTFGASIGALLIVLFMAHIATRRATPVSASTVTQAKQVSQR